MKLFKTIREERKQRLQARLNPDHVAWILWERALINCDQISRQRLTDMYLLASEIDYSHDSISSEVYFAHSLRVAALSHLYSNDTDAALVGLLHNVFEVCADDISFLLEKVEPKILTQIESLNVDRSNQWDDDYNYKYFRRLNEGPSSAGLVKIFDKLDNLFVLGLNPDSKVRQMYLAHFERYILPMIRSLAPDLLDYAVDMVVDARKIGFIGSQEVL
jgi:(p)ppGpp synthase/HD superfamily hydrolase